MKLLLCIGVAAAFAPNRGPARPWRSARATALQMSASAADRQKILITGNNIEISDSLKERVGENLGKVIARHAAAVRQVRHGGDHRTISRRARLSASDASHIHVQYLLISGRRPLRSRQERSAASGRRQPQMRGDPLLRGRVRWHARRARPCLRIGRPHGAIPVPTLCAQP